MSRFFKFTAAALSALPLVALSADESVIVSSEQQPVPSTQTETQKSISSVDETHLTAVAPPLLPAAKEKAVPFTPFTGKIKGRKVRLRAQPGLDGYIVKEVNKNDLVAIVGEKDEFWAIAPPADTKAYVFRSFVLENTIEANRVNVRLKPDLEAPVIGHLNSGDKIDGVICATNNKWLEISAPQETRFFIAKELVENIGGPQVKLQLDQRRHTVEQLLDTTALLSKAELRKPFGEVDIERLSRNYRTIISDYSDFPEYVDQAKEALATLQENFLQKKIAHLETKATSTTYEEIESSSFEEALSSKDDESSFVSAEIKEKEINDRMKLWEPVEEALYLNLVALKDYKSIDEYYDEQKLTAVSLHGILEAYTTPVRNKPGDYIVRDKDKNLPVAYVYSTSINLQDSVGKRVTLICSERPNNHFAFPAYFVHSVE